MKGKAKFIAARLSFRALVIKINYSTDVYSASEIATREIPLKL